MTTTRIPEALPSVEYLRESLDYCPETGVLKWRARPMHHFSSVQASKVFHSRWEGKAAGGLNHYGYVAVRVLGSLIGAHRVAWAIHHGQWATHQIDHINGIKDDNRICNLRDVTGAKNRRGQVKRSNNTSGVTGVFWDRQRGKWRAEIGCHGKNIIIGRYDDIGAATEARKRANKVFDFAECHGNDSQCKISTAKPGNVKRNNTSGVSGVVFVASRNKWRAQMKLAGKQLHIGYFVTKEEAIAARRAAEVQYGVADRVSYGSGPAILQDPPT